MFCKKKTFIKYAVLCAFLAVCGYSVVSYSTSKQQLVEQVSSDKTALADKEVIVENVNYSKFYLIRDFLNVAFSNTLWQENTGEYFARYFEYYTRKLAEKPTDRDRKMLGSGFPFPDWVHAQYAASSGNYPKFGVINKWNKTKIDVALSWPRSGSDSVESESPLLPVIAAQVQRLAPQIKQATQIDINFLQPDDPKENSHDYARIRIVFAWMDDNFFKTLPGHNGFRLILHHGKDRTIETDLYWGAVTFTPYSRSSVDGYFLPDASNNIDLAVCRLSPYLPEDIIIALTSECLLRALGLSDMSKLNQESLLGNWNSKYDPVSKIAAYDPDVSKKIDDYDRSESYVSLTADKFTRMHENYQKYEKFSDYEMKMLKMMYCPSVIAGMDKYQAIKAFADDAGCSE